jgi:hypothetical protein
MSETMTTLAPARSPELPAGAPVPPHAEGSQYQDQLYAQHYVNTLDELHAPDVSRDHNEPVDLFKAAAESAGEQAVGRYEHDVQAEIQRARAEQEELRVAAKHRRLDEEARELRSTHDSFMQQMNAKLAEAPSTDFVWGDKVEPLHAAAPAAEPSVEPQSAPESTPVLKPARPSVPRTDVSYFTAGVRRGHADHVTAAAAPEAPAAPEVADDAEPLPSVNPEPRRRSPSPGPAAKRRRAAHAARPTPVAGASRDHAVLDRPATEVGSRAP